MQNPDLSVETELECTSDEDDPESPETETDQEREGDQEMRNPADSEKNIQKRANEFHRRKPNKNCSENQVAVSLLEMHRTMKSPKVQRSFL